jgi:uncharacterized membrane protein
VTRGDDRGSVTVGSDSAVPEALLDALRVALRFGHAVAAVVWVGGALFYALALTPALSKIGPTPAAAAISAAAGREFGGLVRLAVGVFLVTGAVLAFDRLTQPAATGAYAAVLGLKVALSLWTFWLARRHERAAPMATPGTETARFAREGRRAARLAVLGLAVYLLAIVLKLLFERSLGAVVR